MVLLRRSNGCPQGCQKAAYARANLTVHHPNACRLSLSQSRMSSRPPLTGRHCRLVHDHSQQFEDSTPQCAPQHWYGLSSLTVVFFINCESWRTGDIRNACSRSRRSAQKRGSIAGCRNKPRCHRQQPCTTPCGFPAAVISLFCVEYMRLTLQSLLTRHFIPAKHVVRHRRTRQSQHVQKAVGR